MLVFKFSVHSNSSVTDSLNSPFLRLVLVEAGGGNNNLFPNLPVDILAEGQGCSIGSKS